jgi:hypothetical protein
LSAQNMNLAEEDVDAPTIKLPHKAVALHTGSYYTIANDDDDGNAITQPAGSQVTATLERPPGRNRISAGLTPPLEEAQTGNYNEFDDELLHGENWEKVVTHKSTRVVPSRSTPPTVPVVFNPLVVTKARTVVSTPRTRSKKPPYLSVRLYSWISILVLLCLLLGGAFGLAASYGRGLLGQSAHTSHVISLKVTPSNSIVNGTLTLYGTAFNPHGEIGLTRDQSIALVDTSGVSIIRADSQGSFIDTVIVDSSWGAGYHVIHAEDANSHKAASYTVFITGKGISPRPSHLLFSQSMLDFGSRDQATNSAQIVTLSNTGSSQITWQAAAMQPWLYISPKSGTLSFNQKMNVEVAVGRSSLKPGAYKASLKFTTNTGPAALNVKMVVTQLIPGDNAVLELTPPLLSFTGTDGFINPASQDVTVSNPGVLPLPWFSTAETTDGSSWLTVSPASGTIASGSSQPVTFSVNTRNLLPGVFTGSISFAGQDSAAAKDSPQTIFVSLVVTPQCSIQVSPGTLSFASAYSQPSPPGQAITIGDSQGCSSSLSWSASISTGNGGNWLNVGPAKGVAPANPVVTVNAGGLNPGAYTGSILFNWSGGSQTLPVTYTVGQSSTPIIAVAPSTIAFSGIIGQTAPATQTMTITNPGTGTLYWNASTTSAGGAWLSVWPSSGAIPPQSSNLITVSGALLRTLAANTYSGAITISGTDIFGNSAYGSPLSIPVNLTVQAPCSFAVSPPGLNFVSVAGGVNPAAQPLAITTSGACPNALFWSAKASVGTPAGGTWLATTPSGTVSASSSQAANVSVSIAGLLAGTYSGSVTVTAIDSVTKLAVGAPSVIPITLAVQPGCTLQAPSVPTLTFTTEAGALPASQSFTVGVTGACNGNVTVTPTAASRKGWLAVSAPSTVLSGGNGAFSVTITSSTLAAGRYNGSISLAALNGTAAITGSPQVVGVTLNVQAAPALNATAGTAVNNVSNGTIALPIVIANQGGSTLNWTAALANDAPSYVTLPTTSGTNLVGGSTTSIGVLVNTTGLAAGTSIKTSVIISAIDPLTGQTVAGSPVAVPVNITIPAPQMGLSATKLSITTTAGTNPTAQIINVQNLGGSTLTWTAGAPSKSWLTVSPSSGSDAAGQSTPITFAVNVTGLTVGTHSATVVITPSVGNPITVTVTLTIN